MEISDLLACKLGFSSETTTVVDVCFAVLAHTKYSQKRAKMSEPYIYRKLSTFDIFKEFYCTISFSKVTIFDIEMLICINDSIMLKSDADINRDKIHRVIRNLH